MTLRHRRQGLCLFCIEAGHGFVYEAGDRLQRAGSFLDLAIPEAPVAQLDRVLPSEGKAESSVLWVMVEKIEENQAIGETRRKQQNRFRGHGSIAEANDRERVEYERRQSVGLEAASLALM